MKCSICKTEVGEEYSEVLRWVGEKECRKKPLRVCNKCMEKKGFAL